MTEPRKFKVGDKVQTRDGLPARIIADDATGEQPLVVLIARGCSGYEWTSRHNANGKFFTDNSPSPADLAPLPPAPEVDPKLEAVARAMCESDGIRPNDRSIGDRIPAGTPMWQLYIPQAKLWIAAWRAYCSTEVSRG